MMVNMPTMKSEIIGVITTQCFTTATTPIERDEERGPKRPLCDVFELATAFG